MLWSYHINRKNGLKQFAKMVRGVGFEPTNPCGSGFLLFCFGILSPPPLTRLGYPRAFLSFMVYFEVVDKAYFGLIRVPVFVPRMAFRMFSRLFPFRMIVGILLLSKTFRVRRSISLYSPARWEPSPRSFLSSDMDISLRKLALGSRLGSAV